MGSGCPRTRAAGLALLAWLLWLVPFAAQARPPCELDRAAGSPELRRCLQIEQGIQANLDGHLDRADAIWTQLIAEDSRDPVPRLWQVDTALWRLVLNEGETASDDLILAQTDAVIRLANAALKNRGDDAEALYRKGTSLIQRARLNGVRGHYLAAARDGERGRELLERALVLRPDDTEIKYPLGLYSYYVSVAPRILKWVSWLWFVPKGDRALGLAYLQDVERSEGAHATDASFILTNIHTYHAPLDLTAALQSSRVLHARHPDNALFHSELIEVLVKIGLYDEAIEAALALESSHPEAAEAKVRPQLARILRAQAILLDGRADEAWAVLEPMDAETSELPSWGGAWLNLVRGQIHDARGDRSLALAEYRRVVKLKGVAYNRRAALIAEAGLETPFEPAAYRELPMISAGP